MTLGSNFALVDHCSCLLGHGNDNGCAVEECLVGDGSTNNDPKKETGDYVLIAGGFYSKEDTTGNDKRVTYIANDYYCGTGLGQDSADKKDGTDDMKGVISQVSGPIVIRFVTDDKPGLATGDATEAKKDRVKDELGFSYQYSFVKEFII